MIAKVLGYQGIPTTRTVREMYLGEWVPIGNILIHEADREALWRLAEHDEHAARRVTVVDPVYVVPQMLPCPELGCWEGSLCVQTAVDDYNIVGDCPRCNGWAVVAPPKPTHIATEQYGYYLGGKPPLRWSDDGRPKAGPSFQRRQVVAYKVTATDEWPVFASGHPDEDTVPSYEVDRHGSVYNPEGWGVDEPWAADLTPGRPVWRLHLEALDQPYTHVVERFISDDPDDEGEERWDTAPLSVPVGEVTDIELVDPREKP